MVAHLLGTEHLDSALEELILEKTEGVPFFIEEFVKSLQELKIMERKGDSYRIAKDIQTLTIPATIQDVIMARVDSLSEGAKVVLQVGSVIGREFSHDVIKRVTDLSKEELLSNLSILRDIELLYERGIYPQSSYIFKHAFTQEVAYNSLLVKRKKEIHEKIGRSIEALYPDSLEEYYEMWPTTMRLVSTRKRPWSIWIGPTRRRSGSMLWRGRRSILMRPWSSSIFCPIPNGTRRGASLYWRTRSPCSSCSTNSKSITTS
jgi:hypothetical protein